MFSFAPRIAFGVRRLWVLALTVFALAGGFAVMGAQADSASAAPVSTGLSVSLVVPGDVDMPLGRAWR
jgi:hypothetical protein